MAATGSKWSIKFVVCISVELHRSFIFGTTYKRYIWFSVHSKWTSLLWTSTDIVKIYLWIVDPYDLSMSRKSRYFLCPLTHPFVNNQIHFLPGAYQIVFTFCIEFNLSLHSKYIHIWIQVSTTSLVSSCLPIGTFS